MSSRSRLGRPTDSTVFICLICLAIAAGCLAGSLALGAASRSKATPDDLIRFNNLGIAYLAQYKPAEAEKQFRQALAQDPNYLPGQVNAGIAALAQVHYDDAIAAFKKAIAIHPDNIHALFNLSLIYKLQGKATESLAQGLKALQLDPRDPDLHYHVASLYMTTRQFDRAIQELDTVLKLDPNFLSAYYSLGRAWMSKGEIERGKKFIEKHRELQAGTGATPSVGLRYGEQGKYSFAMEDTGGAGPTKPLAEGAVTFIDVSAGSGIEFMHGATEKIDSLRRPSLAAAFTGRDSLRRTIGPMLGSGVAVADVDGDGKEDLFFVDASGDGKAESALYLNRGAMRFEKASGPGAPAVTDSGMSAAFGDLDRDSDPDLVVAMLDRVLVLVNDGKGKFKDVSADAGVSSKVSRGLLGGVSLADVDHDGDLDIFAAGLLAAPRTVSDSPDSPGRMPFLPGWPGVESWLFINATTPAASGSSSAPSGSAAPSAAPTSNGSSGLKFIESAAKAKVDHAGRRATGAVFSDFDNDRDIDFALASPGEGTSIHSNMRDGTFSHLGSASGLPAKGKMLGLASGDYNKDGWMDIAVTTWDGGLPRLFRNMMGDPAAASGKGGFFALDIASLADISWQVATPQFGVAFLDFDNDGFLDLITVNGGDVGPSLFVFHNEGDGRFTDAGALTGANDITAKGGRGLVSSDLDLDGDLDLIVSNSGGRPTVLRNDGGNKSHWVRIAPTGLHSNKPAIGTKIEVKAGALWQKVEVMAGSGYLSQSSLIPHFGLGDRTRVDTVRLLWPGGVLQDEVQVKPDATFAVKELDRKGSSCPILYAWNGREISFVSDFLGGSAIGYRTGLESFNHPDTDEYVQVTSDQLKPKQGRLELRMVNQLEETIYFDRARLLAVDHPAEYEVYPDERLMPGPPHPRFQLFAVKDARPPLAASDDAGADLLEAVSRKDRIYAGPPAALPFKGYSREHGLVLDLGPLPNGSPILLLLHGWIDYADSSSNLAASQAGVTLVPPYLEALDESATAGDQDRVEILVAGGVRRGRWVPALPQMGFPAGLPKTMTVDLTGKLPAGCRMVRIRTSMRIFWDQVRVATGLGPAPLITGIEADTADLRYRGFPALVEPDGRSPEMYDYSRDQAAVHWKSHVGGFTRYGDVRPLLVAVDDRYVITRPGDEIALEFPAAGLPPLQAGYTRDYLLFADGFGKDMDLNSARPDTVTPLPYHAMSSYPPPPGEGYPMLKDGLMQYIDSYNTRLVVSPVVPLKSH